MSLTIKRLSITLHEGTTHEIVAAVPVAGEVVDDGARVALLGAQRAQVRGLVVRLLGRMLDQVLHAHQRSPATVTTYTFPIFFMA